MEGSICIDNGQTENKSFLYISESLCQQPQKNYFSIIIMKENRCLYYFLVEGGPASGSELSGGKAVQVAASYPPATTGRAAATRLSSIAHTDCHLAQPGGRNWQLLLQHYILMLVILCNMSLVTSYRGNRTAVHGISGCRWQRREQPPSGQCLLPCPPHRAQLNIDSQWGSHHNII